MSILPFSGTANGLRWLLVWGFFTGGGLLAADRALEIVTPNPGQAPTVVLTAEDIARGKQNARSVAEQIRALLAPSAISRSRHERKRIPPKIDIIKGSGGRSTLIYRCRYNTAEKLQNGLEGIISDSGTVEPAVEKNQIIINDLDGKMDELKRALLAIDVRSPQVLVEAKIIEVISTDGMQRNLSVQYTHKDVNDATSSTAGVKTKQLGSENTSGGNVDWTATFGNDSIQTSFQWLQTVDDARILAAPNVVISSHEKAIVTTAQDLPILSFQVVGSSTNTSTEYKRVGITLEVEPRMINEDSVTLRVQPQVSSKLSSQKITQGGDGGIAYEVPVISVRSIDTTLTLDDGQTIIMGGLFQNREAIQQERIPFVADVPLFGELFTSKFREKQLMQLVFFLRVHILRDEELDDGVIYDPDKLALETEALGDIIRNAPSLPPPGTTLEQIRSEFIDRDKPEKSFVDELKNLLEEADKE